MKRPKLFVRAGIWILALVLLCGNPAVLLDASAAGTQTASTIEEYYAGLDATLLGTAFRAELDELITETHTHETTYSELQSVFLVSDADPDQSGNIIWFYTGTSVPFNGFGSGYGSTNREHVWPKDAGNAFPETSQAGSDAHHLRPCEAQLNSTRGNQSFDEVATTASNIVAQNGSTSYGNLCYSNGVFFYPGEGYRGATARILMYVQTRWGDEFNLYFVDAAGKTNTIGKISTLLKWHLEEPPTEEEIRRNEAIYQIQGNRNPFIDHPEYAAMIYCNDGQSYNDALMDVMAEYGDYERPAIGSIGLPTDHMTLIVGQTVDIVATVTPADALRDILWSSDDSTVATVTGGTVTAVKNGTTTITAASAADPSIQATLVLSVKSVDFLTLSGTLIRTVYLDGDRIEPSGLTVTVTYTDGSSATVPADSCEWLDGVTGGSTLSPGTTSLLCRLGGKEVRYEGITVDRIPGTAFTLDRSDFGTGSSYTWAAWSDGGIEGYAYIYLGTVNRMQFNTNNRPSYYLYNTTPLTGGILSITVRMNTGEKNWEIYTSSTPYGQMNRYPTTGTSHGVQTVTTEGVTWEINTTDEYFTLNYMGSGVAYIESVTIRYNSSPNVGETGGETGTGIGGETGELPVNSSPEDFTAAVSAITDAQTPEEIFLAIQTARILYNRLDEDEKNQVTSSYQTMMQAVDAYNNLAEGQNSDLQAATGYALAVFASRMTAMAALLFLVKSRALWR